MFGKCAYQNEEAFESHTSRASYDNNGGHALLDEREGVDQAVESEERRETDVRFLTFIFFDLLGFLTNTISTQHSLF